MNTFENMAPLKYGARNIWCDEIGYPKYGAPQEKHDGHSITPSLCGLRHQNLNCFEVCALYLGAETTRFINPILWLCTTSTIVENVNLKQIVSYNSMRIKTMALYLCMFPKLGSLNECCCIVTNDAQFSCSSSVSLELRISASISWGITYFFPVCY